MITAGPLSTISREEVRLLANQTQIFDQFSTNGYI